MFTFQENETAFRYSLIIVSKRRRSTRLFVLKHSAELH